MKKLGKFAAAFAAAAMITALAGCSENGGSAQQSQQTPAAQPVRSAQSSTTQSAESTQSSQKQSAQSAPASSSAEVSSSAAPTSEPQSAPTEGFPEEPSEASLKYFDDAMGIVDKYLSTVMGNGDEVEQLGLLELYTTNESAALQKVKEYVLDCAKKGESYLDELEKLTPTEEMSAFHNGLVNLMSVMREYSDIAKSLETIDMTDEAVEEEFMGKVDELFERFNKEYRAFYVKYPGFGNVLDDGEWQSNGASTAQYFTPNLAEEARDNAQTALVAVTYAAGNLSDKNPLFNAVIEINKARENELVITGASLSEKDLAELERTINAYFPTLDRFWARVYMNENARPVFAMFSPDGQLEENELNSGSGFESNVWEWSLTGVTSGGHIFGMVGVPPTAVEQ